jgi:sugar-specific transcriptional regulator TrmB
MEELLLQLGFKSKEARTYLAALELGSSTITAIAKRAGINRTTTYDIIYDLEKQGLVKQVGGTKKQIYAAAPAEKLPLIMEARARQFSDLAKKAATIIPQLKMVEGKKSGKPKIELFEGKPGIKSLYEDTLLSTEDIRSFSSTESLESFEPQYLHDYYERRAKKGIFMKAIINDAPSAHEYKKDDKKLLREVRIVPKEKMDITPEVYVYENKVAFFSLEERFAVLIESLDIATAIKKLFDLAWDKSAEYDHKLSGQKSKKRLK